jgi:uncharacterized protein (TIGR01777 family)
MKLLITGATGLVGRALVHKALSEGFKIHFLTTNKNKATHINGAKGFYWNPSQSEIDIACFEGVDTIIHLAGASISKLWTSKNKKQIRSSRIDSTRLLLSSIEQLKTLHQVKQIVAASAIGIYPPDFDNTVDENTPVHPNSFMEDVVISWEREVDQFKSLDIKVAKLRIGLVLSAQGGVLGPLRIPTALGLGAAFGNGKQGQSWIHIKDVVGLFIAATSAQWEGAFNAVAPHPVSQTKFIKALSKALKRPYFLPPIPKFLIRFTVGEMSSLVLDSHWVSADKVLKNGYVFSFPNIEEAMEEVAKQKI